MPAWGKRTGAAVSFSLSLSRTSLCISLPLLLLLLLPLLPNDIPQRIINYLIKPRALEAREVSGKKIFAPLKADARERDRQRKLRRIARWQIRRGSSTAGGEGGERGRLGWPVSPPVSPGGNKNDGIVLTSLL